MTTKSVNRNLKKNWAVTDKSADNTGIVGFDNDFFNKMTVTFPPPKRQITIRLDEDVLMWIKGKGRGYHTWINAILRSYYEAHKHETTER